MPREDPAHVAEMERTNQRAVMHWEVSGHFVMFPRDWHCQAK